VFLRRALRFHSGYRWFEAILARCGSICQMRLDDSDTPSLLELPCGLGVIDPVRCMYDPWTLRRLQGWRLTNGGGYTPANQPDKRGWLWSEQMGLC